MDIEFRNNNLKNMYLDERYGQKQLGATLHRKYVQRVEILKAIEAIDDLMNEPAYKTLRYHPLRGNREGQHSIDIIKNRERLIFTIKEGVPTIIRIEEVHKEHYEKG